MSDGNCTPVQDRATELRALIEELKAFSKQFVDDLKFGDIVEAGEKTDKGEQIANAMLSYRHLEDAKMKLGMVIKATVGVSVYDTAAADTEGEAEKEAGADTAADTAAE